MDEIDLMVHPIIVGRGERLSESEGPQVPLELVECATWSTGVTRQVYRMA